MASCRLQINQRRGVRVILREVDVKLKAAVGVRCVRRSCYQHLRKREASSVKTKQTHRSKMTSLQAFKTREREPFKMSNPRLAMKTGNYSEIWKMLKWYTFLACPRAGEQEGERVMASSEATVSLHCGRQSCTQALRLFWHDHSNATLNTHTQSCALTCRVG